MFPSLKEFVCGFLFSPGMDNVLLIEKRRPAWQAGKLNGIGGKIERTDPNAYHAMRREFKEEAGVVIDTWLSFRHEMYEPGHYGQDNAAHVHFFVSCATPPEWNAIHKMTDEELWRVPVEFLLSHTVMTNLPYLIPMARILWLAKPCDRPLP